MRNNNNLVTQIFVINEIVTRYMRNCVICNTIRRII